VSFLLDTNVVAEVRKKRMNPGVRSWFEAAPPEQLFLSVLVLGEIHQGVVGLRRRDARQAAVYDRWLSRLRREYAERLLPVTDEVAMVWGRLNAKDPLPVVDGLLAATALVHNLSLVTRNVSDFERTGVELLDPFE
jgi:hypothetical protein